MLDNLKLEYVLDFQSVQVSFDLHEGMLEKINSLIGSKFTTGRYGVCDYHPEVLLVADIKVGHEWFTLQAYMEEGRVFLSKGAHLGLDYTKLFPEDFVDQWPEFIQPLRAIAEVLA